MNRSIFQDTERMCKTDAELSAVTKISVANQRFIAEAEVIPTPELNIYKRQMWLSQRREAMRRQRPIKGIM